MPRDIHPEAQDEPGAGGRGAQAHGARDHFASRDESAEFDELEDPGDPGDPEDPGDSEDLGDLEDIELIPMDSGALLTPEEIEAFRD